MNYQNVLTTTVLAMTAGVFCERVAFAGPGDDVAACIKSSDHAQDLRDKGQLLEAREGFVLCARDVCPGQIRASCAEWLMALAPRIPTLIIAGKDRSGHDVTDGQVYIDGKKVEDALSGRAFPVDPGKHKVRVVREGQAPTEVEVVIREGEPRRIVPVVLSSNDSAVAVDGNEKQTNDGKPREQARAQPATSSGPPLGSWVLAGVGLGAIAGGAVFGLSGVSQFNDLKAGCGKASSCSADDVSGVRTKLVASDIFFGVGIAAMAAGAILWILHKPDDATTGEKPNSAAFRLVPAASGWALQF